MSPDLQAVESTSGSVRVRISTDRPWLSARLIEMLRNIDSIEVLSSDEAAVVGQPADVLLVDCAALPAQDYRKLQRTARRHHPARVLWLLSVAPTSRQSIRSVLDAVKDGWCHGYIADDCHLDTLVRTITAVAGNDVSLPRTMLVRALSEAESLRASMRPAGSASRGSNAIRTLLTRRERQILRLVQFGLTNKEVGRQLAIQEDTVKKHLRNVYAKLGVHRRVQLMFRSDGAART
jgi:DNA-binding NarL/FixJ family response regulator